MKALIKRYHNLWTLPEEPLGGLSANVKGSDHPLLPCLVVPKGSSLWMLFGLHTTISKGSHISSLFSVPGIKSVPFCFDVKCQEQDHWMGQSSVWTSATDSTH